MVTRSFTLMAAMASAFAGSASAQESSQPVQLGVTATVVRPAEMMIYPTPVDGAVALIRHPTSIEVIADGGTVQLRDGEIKVLPSFGSSSVTVTLVF